jgi:cell division protein FtsI (penicillin-binding protein 3)
VKRPPMGRLVALLCGLLVALGGILVRLSVLQVSQSAVFHDRALDQRIRPVTLPATRGRILDRSGMAPLALSLDARDIYADPRFVADPVGEAETIAPILDMKVGQVLASLTDDPATVGDETFSFVARQVDLEVAEEVERLRLAGVGFLEVSKRYYPAGSLASQVLGFVGTDGEGLSGLEFGYQAELAGRAGRLVEEIDPNGQPIAGAPSIFEPPVAGRDVVTTIYREFQYQVQAALAEAVRANQAKGGTVVVMNPATGDIYAMATYPWFDPNLFEESPRWSWRNRAVTDAMEPGSVNKVITAAVAIEEATLSPDERLVVPDQIRVEEFTIHDSHAHPIQRMTLGDIVAQSSNVGAIKVAQTVGAERMYEYLWRFGFGRETGTGFPGESDGILPTLSHWSNTTLSTMAYGQGISVTPLQMTSVFATIANGGVWVQPRLVQGTLDADGAYHDAPAARERRVVSESTAKMVARMLAYAVSDGTGRQAQLPGYQVAGKTGTARIPLPDRPGYYENRHMASFIGFLPASAPRVVIAAILDQPATVYGGVAAAPLFQEVARYAVQRLGIGPSRPLPLPPHALAV